MSGPSNPKQVPVDTIVKPITPQLSVLLCIAIKKTKEKGWGQYCDLQIKRQETKWDIDSYGGKRKKHNETLADTHGERNKFLKIKWKKKKKKEKEERNGKVPIQTRIGHKLHIFRQFRHIRLQVLKLKNTEPLCIKHYWSPLT